MPRPIWCASLLCLYGAFAATTMACSGGDDSTSPAGSGNDIHVDVDATTQAPQMGEPDGNADSPFARVETDGGYYGSGNYPDGYSPYATCQNCACAANEYCFGGGTGYTTFSGDCHPTTFGIGCQPIPAACTGAEDAGACACLINATVAMVPCYPECAAAGLILYCSNP